MTIAMTRASSIRDLVFGVACILTVRIADRFGPRIVISLIGFLFQCAVIDNQYPNQISGEVFQSQREPNDDSQAHRGYDRSQ